MNSVISISVRFCPVLFIYLFTPIEGPMIHQNIQGGICGPDGLDLVHVILRGPIENSGPRIPSDGPECVISIKFKSQIQTMHTQCPWVTTFEVAPINKKIKRTA